MKLRMRSEKIPVQDQRVSSLARISRAYNLLS
jgi:hypothetical protein